MDTTTKREEVNVQGSTADLLMLMAEGNPGAISVMAEILKDPDGLMLLLHLDDMNIRGTQIWVGYKDYCGQDIAKFKGLIIARDHKMIAHINREGASGNHPHKAIHSGASYGKRELL